MGAGQYPLLVQPHADFLAEITWTDDEGQAVNLSGYTAKMQIRDAPNGNLIQDLTVAPNTLTVQPAGVFLAYMPASVTATLAWTHAYFDLVAISGSGYVYRVLEGPVYLDLGVTQ